MRAHTHTHIHIYTQKNTQSCVFRGKCPTPPSHKRSTRAQGMMNAVSGDKAPDKSQGPLSGALRDLGYAPEEVFKF